MNRDAHRQVARRFVHRVMALNGLREFLVTGSAWAFVWGTGVLVLRVATDWSRGPMLAGAAGFAAVAVWAVARAWRARPNEAAVIALSDQRSGAGGLLMAGEERPLGAWETRVPDPSLPGVRWRGGWTWSVFVGAGVFVAVAFLAPAQLDGIVTSPRLNISDDTHRLEGQIEVLAEEQIIDKDQADAMERRLARIREDASGRDPARTWESLDHIAGRMKQIAEQAAEAAIDQTASLTQTQALAEALAHDAGPLQPGQLVQAMSALAEMARQAAAEDAGVDQKLGEALRDALEAGALSQEQLSQLAEALRGRKMEMGDTLQRLVEAKLIDARMLEAAQGAGECDSEGLCEFLALTMNQGGVKDALKSWGRGGISRGRGDADMTWNQQASSQEGTRFQEQVLPPSTLEAMKESRMVGLSAGAPTRDVDAAPAVDGALGGAPAGGGSAVSHVVLPRHREAVERYFDRGQ